MRIYWPIGAGHFNFADPAFQPANRDFDQALRLNPENADAYVGRGLARVMLGTHREAVADADDALRRQPRTPEMMHNVACIFALAAACAEKNLADKETPALTARCRERALEAVRQTLAMVPPAERSVFWREKIAPDPALDSIRNLKGFRDLAQ